MSNSESLHEFAARMGVFTKNRAAFPEDELMKYAGQWVAWSPDGTAIVASSTESQAVVYDSLKSKGYNPGLCCISYVDYADDVELGTGLFLDDLEDAEAKIRNG